MTQKQPYKVMNRFHARDKTPVRGMTVPHAHKILNRVRAGDKTLTRLQIDIALVLTGDITSRLSPMVQA